MCVSLTRHNHVMELFSQPKKRKTKMPKRKIETLAQWVVLSSKSNLLVWVTILTLVRLMCVLRAHIKLSMFRNIFSKIKKIVSTFSISEKYFSKNENYCVFRTHINKIFFKKILIKKILYEYTKYKNIKCPKHMSLSLQ